MNDINKKRSIWMMRVLWAVAVCLTPVVAEAAQEISWSVELAPENSDYLLIQIDASSWPTNATCNGIRFRVKFLDAQNAEISTDDFELPKQVAGKLRPGVVNAAYMAHSRLAANSVQGLSLSGTYGPLGGKADDVTAGTVVSSSRSGRTGKAINIANASPARRSVKSDGNLLWYRDTKRDGTSEIANPKVIGRGGWQGFKHVFGGGDGVIYAIDPKGELLWYIDAKRDGTGEVANSKIVGPSGWAGFGQVFGAEDGVIYATTSDGNLLWSRNANYKTGGNVSAPKVIGKGGWQSFKHVFYGGNGILYAITAEGDLLFYRDSKRDGTGDVANPKVIGKGGWQLFKSVFAGGDGSIYAITPEGNLLWYKDRRRDGSGEIANPRIIGQGGWQRFKHVFDGGGGIIYAIMP